LQKAARSTSLKPSGESINCAFSFASFPFHQVG
jgi:hypothetical protein